MLIRFTVILWVGYCYNHYTVYRILEFQLPLAWEGLPLIIKGKIDTIPFAYFSKNKKKKTIFFKIKINEICYQEKCLHDKAIFRLQGENLKLLPHAGEYWQFPVILKRIHGTFNNGIINKEFIAFRDGVRAEGKILITKTHFIKRIKEASWWSIDAKREIVLNQLKLYLPNTTTSHWIIALLIGERHDVLPEEWRVLRQTGTNHLFAIAGLHLGLLAGMIYWMTGKCLKIFPTIFLRVSLPYLAHGAACISIFLYSTAAGFSIPTLRAFCMYAMYAASLYARWSIKTWQIWSLALLFTLIFDPLAILQESFWLSFVIVAWIIFYFKNRTHTIKKNKFPFFYELIKMQMVISLGVCALSIYFFSEISLIGFVANLISVPWLECFVLPFAWMGVLSLPFSHSFTVVLFSLADMSLQGLWSVLNFFTHLPFAVFKIVLPISGILFVFFLTICCLLPRGLKYYFFIMIGLIALIRYEKNVNPIIYPKLTILDVGQGLAILFETQHHTLVYDTGGALPPFYDSGETIIAPILLGHHRNQIDKLIISHGDLDHRGGANYLIKHFLIKDILTSAPQYFKQAVLCVKGQSWQWDNVNFSMIFPEKNTILKGNNASCVLKINYGNQSILLPGDIEKAAQLEMLKDDELKAVTILIAPHHGSKTSYQETWMNIIHPQHVIFAIGYNNKFYFPHTMILEKYRELGSQLWNTADCGQIEFELFKSQPPHIICHRKEHARIWLDQVTR